MRLAFVDIDDPEDLNTWSGIPHHILQELRRQGVQVEVIAPLERPFKYWFAPQKIASKLVGKSIQVNRRPVALRSFAEQIERRLAKGKCDAVFSTSSIPIACLRPALPVLYWTDAVIDSMADYYSGAFANLDVRELRLAHTQEQKSMNRASFAIYSSQWAAQIVKDSYDVSVDKVRVIEFGANLSVTHDLSTIMEWNRKRLESPCTLLFIGVDWNRKGGDYAFEAASLLNQRGIKTVLKVVGGGGPEAPFVEKLGFINKNSPEGERQIKELLATSTFFFMPTRAEAAGIVFCEAGAFGLPAITTKTGGVESYVIDSETGYCLPVEARGSEYADLIASALVSSEEYNRLSIAAFNRYRQTLNWQVGVSSLINLVQRAIRN